MSITLPRATTLLLATCLILTAGCFSSSSSVPAPGDESAAGDKPEVLLEPYDPPPLAELDAKAEWVDQPVVDGMKQLREFLDEHPAEVSVEQALKMKNDSDAANDKIISALGRLPKNDDEVNWDATFRRHLSADVGTFNPVLASSLYDSHVHELLYAGLFGWDFEMKPYAVADTVVSWQSSKDRMYDKVVMRDDVTWSDGKPFTAHDVAFSFQLIMNPAVPVPAVRTGTDQLRWVEAYDDHTVVFFHKQPLATNMWNITFPIVAKHVYEDSIAKDPSLVNSEYHVGLENQPVTSGAYQVKSRRRGEEIVLERREEWFMHNGKEVRRKPYIKSFRFLVISDNNTALLALNSGTIDELQLQPEQWTTEQTNSKDFSSKNVKVYGTEWSYSFVGWNIDTAFFSDVRVRQAMSYALDHQELLDKLMAGLYAPGQGIFHPEAWMAPKKMPAAYHQDLAKAEALLADAGWEDHDGDGVIDKEIDGRLVPFRFTLSYGKSPLTEKIATLFYNNLQRIGVICEPQPLEFTNLLEKARNHQFSALLMGMGTGTDPSTNDNLFATGQGRNYFSYSNKDVDQWFKDGEREVDPVKRAAIYAKIHNQIYADQPMAFLYYRTGFYGFSKELRGYRFSPRGPYGFDPGVLSFWKPR